MTEMRRMSCPSCAADNVPLAVVDGITEYRCRGCGLVFYGPCGCDVVHGAEAPAASGLPELDERLGDWQMSRPPVALDDAAGVKKYLGCS